MTIFVASTTALGCEKTPETSVVASRHEMTLGEYFDESGQSATRKWQAEDNVTLLRIKDGKAESCSASPIMAGRKEGLFMFNMEGYGKGCEVVAYFPSDAPVSYEDGKVKVAASEIQDGSFKTLFIGEGISNGSSYLDIDMNLKPYWHTFHVTVAKGDYSISGAEFISDEQNITVRFPEARDCSKASQKFYMNLPPMTLKNGYIITFSTTDGRTFDYSHKTGTICDRGGISEIVNVKFPAKLVVCGDNMIYMIDAEKAAETGFESAVIWQWDASTVANTVGADMVRLDDCKVVDNNSKILATSSRSWAVLIDIATRELLWWSYKSAEGSALLKNAHSADLLPGERIAVACSGQESEGGGKIQVFDMGQPNRTVCMAPLASAHGVVWNETTQRLYAVGGTSLNVYTLNGWDTTPSLVLEKSIDTSDSVTGLHDLTLVNPTTLLLAGRKAALYDLNTGRFTSLPFFSKSTAIKSVNYNPTSGECWFTDATDPDNQAAYDWSSKSVLFTSDVAGQSIDRRIAVPDGFNMYKVRVMNW